MATPSRFAVLVLSLTILSSSDPAEPFVYNEELEIRIQRASAPHAVLQTSPFGSGSTDYRIEGQKYITIFKTLRRPARYIVEVWRPAKGFLIGSFSFETVRR